MTRTRHRRTQAARAGALATMRAFIRTLERVEGRAAPRPEPEARR
jgi:hypothetical protein